jgi:hypothetical protein
MTPFSANPFAYIFPAIAFAAVAVYYMYGAIDRIGLDTHAAEARVTGKQYAPGSTTYNTNVVAGRAWTQSQQNPDNYVVTLEVEGETTAGLVTKEMYESLKTDDRVHVHVRRTRISKQLQVTDVSR